MPANMPMGPGRRCRREYAAGNADGPMVCAEGNAIRRCAGDADGFDGPNAEGPVMQPNADARGKCR